MATYVFKAMDITGAQAARRGRGRAKQAVADQLKQRGPDRPRHRRQARLASEINLELFKRIKAGDLTIMTRQLATMVSSRHDDPAGALRARGADREREAAAEVLVKVRKDVEAGLPLSDALERHPKVFNPLFVAMTRAGETGGMLDDALLRVADQLEKEDALRRQVKSAMVYPIVVIELRVCVLIALVAFLVPVFVGVFKQFGGDLPAITKFTVGDVRTS